MSVDWLSVGLGCGISVVMLFAATFWAACFSASNAHRHYGNQVDFKPDPPSKLPVYLPPPPLPETNQKAICHNCHLIQKITGK